MGKKKKIEASALDNSQQVMPGEVEEKRPVKYVVIRDGYRVSDKEYEDPKDTNCVSEFNFWLSVEKNHSHGAIVDIVPYDSKKHRVW